MEEQISRRGKILWCFLQLALFSLIFLSEVPSLGHAQTILKIKRRGDRRRREDGDDGGKESEGELIEGSNERTRNAGSKTSTVKMQGDKELER
jgi:hypothetical protein